MTLACAKLMLHVLLSGRYGYHVDELYFIECGRQLAWGYVDHPPMIGLWAAVAGVLFDHSLFGLRLISGLAGTVGLLLTMLFARALGGDVRAQALAGLCFLFTPAYLRMGVMLNIVVFEPIFWTAGALLVLRIVKGAHPRLWLAVGVVVGAGLLNKHTMLLWVAGLGAGLLATPLRAQLRTPWPWLGGLVAAAIVSPNVAWQLAHDTATLEFVRNMSASTLAAIPRAMFLLGQVLYMHPLHIPVWGAGLVWLRRAEQGRYRVFCWQFIAVIALLLFTRGKPYYAAAAYPVLFAAGSIALVRWFDSPARHRRGRVSLAVLVAGQLFFAALSLPLLPLTTVDATLERLFGAIIKPEGLTYDMHNEFGWVEQVDVVERVYRELPGSARGRATIFTGSYGQASAINFFGQPRGLPRAHSGHMTYFLWGQLPADGTLIVYGLGDTTLGRLCARPQLRGEIDHPLAMRRHVPIYVCAPEDRLPYDAKRLKRYGFGAPSQRPSAPS